MAKKPLKPKKEAKGKAKTKPKGKPVTAADKATAKKVKEEKVKKEKAIKKVEDGLEDLKAVDVESEVKETLNETESEIPNGETSKKSLMIVFGLIAVAVVVTIIFIL